VLARSVGVTRLGQHEADRDHTCGVEAEAHAAQVAEGGDEQAGADEQHHGERRLPDDERVLLDLIQDRAGVYFRGLEGGPAVRVGDGSAGEISPDGRRIAYLRRRGGTSDLWLLPVGPGEPRLLAPGDDRTVWVAARWFPDGGGW
jgi:hypothetical protein